VPFVPWRIQECDLMANPSMVADAEPGSGIGVVFRRKSVPIGFALFDDLPVPGGDACELAEWLDDELPCRVIELAIREELAAGLPSDAGCSVSIAICTRDRPEWLERLLSSLAELDRTSVSGLVELEILVVDNAPADDRSRLVAAGFPAVRYVIEPKPGLNFGRNAALRQAQGDLVAYLDDDVVVDRGWLIGLLSAYAADRQAGFITGQVLPLEIATSAQLLFERRGGFRRGFRRVHYGQSRVGDAYYPCGAGIFGTGANMAVNRAAALAIGGFDEALDTGQALPGGGDLDLFYRMIRAGHRATYDPSYLVYHQHRRKFADLRRQYRDSWGRAYMAFAMKSLKRDPAMRGTWLRHIAWWFSKQTVHLLRRFVARHPRPIRLILAETWGGVMGLFGAYDRSCARVARIKAGPD
jgi:glycosyltransferase involved in cell wall biosynthesis